MEAREKYSKLGILLVITGRSGAGKDTIFTEIIKRNILDLKFSQVITNATRPPRENEIHGKDYYFISHKELLQMHLNGELVEDPVPTGTSLKGTSKRELEKILEGENLVWRIDIERAAEVATGDFFNRVFDNQLASILHSQTKVVYIDVDDVTLEGRRKARDGKNYDPNEYIERDIKEKELINSHAHKFKHVIANLDNQVNKTINEIENIVGSILSLKN